MSTYDKVFLTFPVRVKYDTKRDVPEYQLFAAWWELKNRLTSLPLIRVKQCLPLVL